MVYAVNCYTLMRNCSILLQQSINHLEHVDLSSYHSNDSMHAMRTYLHVDVYSCTAFVYMAPEIVKLLFD